MKKIICTLLAIILVFSFPLSANASELISCSFESGESSALTLNGNAKTVNDTEKNSRVLYLDGSNNTYAEFPEGLFDSLDTATILFDIKPVSMDGNFFTFAIGLDNTRYSFFRIRGKEARNAITTDSYYSEKETKTTLNYTEGWMSVAIVFDGVSNRLYINGNLCAENSNTGIKLSDLKPEDQQAQPLKAYLGKSFYSGDSYYKGYFDNLKVYDTVLSENEIKNNVCDTLPLLASLTVGSCDSLDSHTAVFTDVNRDSGEINSYVKKSQPLNSVDVTAAVSYYDSTVTVNGKEVTSFPCKLDLTSPATLKITRNGREESYKINTPKLAYNPVLNGQYADPDIDILDGRFWIFPTTDGVDGWGGTQFHAFSSLDLVNWIDEGVILDVKEKSEKKNALGINIAASPWSDGNAWAPSIEQKNGKYYFYYCGNVKSDLISLYGEGKAIGVAWASSPNGPYTALDKPLIYPKLMEDSSIGFWGQTIDPSVFTDSDGASYLYFGNGGAACAKLNSNMISIDSSSLKMINNLNDFRESVTVFKRNGVYYYTWSCDDTGSENYHINWGYTKTLNEDITNQGTLVSKDEKNGILATGHQSVIYIPESDKCFIAYHRFLTPLGLAEGGYGFHRETCIDEITFTKGWLGVMPDTLNSVTPSYAGTGTYNVNGKPSGSVIPSHYTPKPVPSPSAPSSSITVGKTAVKKLIKGKKRFTVKWKKVSPASGYIVQYSLKKNMKKAKTKTVNGGAKTKLTVKKLKSKKKYYVRVKAFKKINGEIYYSPWSKTKSVKTK